jgi:hypothetical protein
MFEYLYSKWRLLFSLIALFCFFLCLGEFGLVEFRFREEPAGPEAREKGRILVEV